MPRYKSNPFRRPRYSSSDSDRDFSRPTPKRPNTKSYTLPITPSDQTYSTMSTPDQNVSTYDLYQLMLGIKQSQDSLRSSLEQRITNLESKFTSEIQKGLKKLKDEMTMEFASVENRMKTLEEKMIKYESDLQQVNTTVKMSDENSSQHKLVFKNIVINNTDKQSLQAYVNGVLRAIGLDFDTSDVQQIGGQNNGSVNNATRKKK